MISNYTAGYQEWDEDTIIRGVSLGGEKSRSINIWSFTPTDDTRNRDISTYMEIYHSKAQHSLEKERFAPPTYQDFEKEYYEADKTTFPQDPFDEEFSETRYKWSNDSQLYTELSSPGIEETDYGYLIFYVGEKNPLDNNMTKNVLNTPRNIGVHFVSKNFDDLRTT